MLSRFLVALGCLGFAVTHGPPDSPLLLFLQNLPSQLPRSNCKQALLHYLHSLQRGDDWALNMYDSSTKYPDGILATNGYSLGHFDQCLESGTDTFSGKYCLVNARYLKTDSTLPVNRFKVNRNEVYFALCIPSDCDAKVIETAVQNALVLFPGLRNFHINATINENHCSTRKTPTDNSVNTWLWFSVILAAAVYLIGFSAPRHWRRLFYHDPEAITCIHGLRVVALSLVVVGHRAEAIASGPLFNPDSIEKLFETGLNVFLLNGTVIVDTFFTISGFLLCWNILKCNQPKLTWWRLLSMRYLRLVPCYAVVIAVQALVMENVSSGPLWKMKVGKEAANCRQNWWANLLFINNYWDPQHICLDPSWYLACDMQFFLLGILVIIPLAQWTRYKTAPLTLASFVSVLIPFFVTYFNGLDPTIIPDPATVGKTFENQTNILLYITGYCRAGPYFIGVATAYFLHQLRQSRQQIDKIFWSCGWYFAGCCILGSVTLGWPFFTTTKVNPLLTAFYAATFRTVFSIGIAFIISYGVCQNQVPFLSAEPLRLLSKVSYSVYLIHTLWIQLSYSWIRSPVYSSDLYQAGLILSDLVVCTILGIVFHVLVEAPLSEIFYKRKMEKMKSY